MSNIKYIVSGLVASSIVDIGSVTLAQVNTVLQTVSLVVGISLATITLFHALRRNDWKHIDERLSQMEGRCSLNHPPITSHSTKAP
jgi:putative flippase GtrA